MIKLNKVKFKYGSGEAGEKQTLSNINLEIKKGEVIIITGESGCGKTTVGRLVNGLCPNFYPGEMQGDVSVGTINPAKQALSETSRIVGSIFQNPRTQFFNVDTTSEITFACENQGLERGEIIERLDSIVRELGLEKLMNRSIFELSGGEKQRIACASVATAQSQIVVMDEPSSNLDLSGIEDLKRIIAKWKSEGKTIIVAEHRLYYLRDLADRLVIMHDGEIEKIVEKGEIAKLTAAVLHEMGLRTMSVDQLFETDISREVVPYRDGAYKVENLRFKYGRHGRGINIENIEISTGKIIALVGLNGAGKSTFAKCLCGLSKDSRDIIIKGNKRLSRNARIKDSFLVMQDVNAQLFADSVINEIMLSLREKYGSGFSAEKHEKEALEILKLMDLEEFRDRHPISLSGGQKQRVAIADAIASDKKLIIFDEPTSGLDYKHMLEVADVLRMLADMGKAVIVITHDIELILLAADNVICLEDGKVTDEYALDNSSKNKLQKFLLGGTR
jgi:energy-coupling factor transport system ATP-binding protein